MTIEFTDHALDKISRLEKRGIFVSKEKVIKILTNPKSISPGVGNRIIAQGDLIPGLILRVVYERENSSILIVTLYPGSKSRYEK